MNTLTIAGTGACAGHMTSELVSSLKSGASVLLQTGRTYLSEWLTNNGVAFETVDAVYDSVYDFDELNAAIARRVVDLLKGGDVIYCVTGTPAGKAVCGAIANSAAKVARVKFLPGVSFADAALFASGITFDVPAVNVYSQDARNARFDVGAPLIVSEIDGRILAGDVKLALLEYYPDELSVALATQNEGEYSTREIHLFDLDRQGDEAYAHTTCVIVPPVTFENLSRRGVRELDELISILRAPGGCPWDREQTVKSLRASVLEVAYEVAEAIDSEDDNMLCEELGDLLLQVVFLSRIADEHGSFTLRDVTTDICSKLVYRHPHVFGSAKADTSADVLAAWDKLKMKEKHQATQTDALNSVPKTLPALTRSAKVQKKAAAVGFDWTEAYSALAKVREEADEFEAELKSNGRTFEEMGDLLFAVVNAARLSKIDAELALVRATEKFTRRFAAMESIAIAKGKPLSGMTLDEMDEIWCEVKKSENCQ